MDTLSDDILIHIFAQGTAKDISLWRRVAKCWNDLINDDFVWKRAFSTYWQNHLPIARICPESWKDEYVTRMTELNKMSTRNPKSIRICTKKSEIKDISIATSSLSPNSLIKVLDLHGLTSAIIRPDGRLDQKFILYFENMFGEAPLTFCHFHRPAGSNVCSLILGFAEGSLVIFPKCPSKTLLEDYKRIPSTVCSSPVVAVIPHTEDPLNNLLIVHKHASSACHEFVNLQNSLPTAHIVVSALKAYCLIYSNQSVVKIAYFSQSGDLFIVPLVKEQTEQTSILRINTDISTPITLHANSKYLLIVHSNRIYIVDHSNSTLITSFTLTTIKTIKSIQELSSDSADILELFLLTDDASNAVHLRIDPNANSLEQEVLNFDESDQILSIYVTQVYFILVSLKGIFVHDTLTRKQINKCTFPKYFLKYLDWHEEDNAAVRIEPLDSNRFLFIWGSSLAQIWDFNPSDLSKTALKLLQKTQQASSETDKGLLGAKAIRKYSKYAVTSGFQEWTDECDEEAHLAGLRNRMNIDGLTEDEMIAYAKLISQGSQQPEGQQQEQPENPSIFTDPDMDPDLRLALQLSLIEM